MKLIREWRQAWKFSSVQTALLLSLMSAAYALLPEFREFIPLYLYAILMIIGSLGIAVLRIISQGITDK